MSAKDDFNRSRSKKPRDYVFFKAGGASLEALEKAERMYAEKQDTLDKLCVKFGAYDVDYDAENLDDAALVYRTGTQSAPEGWTVKDGQDPTDDYVSYQPPRDSDAKEQITAALAMIAHTEDCDSIEKILGTGPMPDRAPPNGPVPEEFVIEHFELSKNEPRGVTEDTMRDRATPQGDGVPDPITYETFNDHWYIRVPCDEDGNPRTKPPGATHVSFREMYDLDQIEQLTIKTGVNVHRRNGGLSSGP